MKNYPNRLKELSEIRGWKQADLAREIGWPPQVVERFWNQKRRLHQDHLNAFSKVFQVPPEEIISKPKSRTETDLVKMFRGFNEVKRKELMSFVHFLEAKKD